MIPETIARRSLRYMQHSFMEVPTCSLYKSGLSLPILTPSPLLGQNCEKHELWELVTGLLGNVVLCITFKFPSLHPHSWSPAYQKISTWTWGGFSKLKYPYIIYIFFYESSAVSGVFAIKTIHTHCYYYPHPPPFSTLWIRQWNVSPSERVNTWSKNTPPPEKYTTGSRSLDNAFLLKKFSY